MLLHNDIKYLTIIGCFNKEFIMPKNITHLKLECLFNYILNIPFSIQYLTFGSCYTEQIYLTKYHVNLIYLDIGKNYNKYIYLPNNLKYFKSSYHDLIYRLPKTIKELLCYNLAKYVFNNKIIYKPFKIFTLINVYVDNMKIKKITGGFLIIYTYKHSKKYPRKLISKKYR